MCTRVFVCVSLCPRLSRRVSEFCCAFLLYVCVFLCVRRRCVFFSFLSDLFVCVLVCGCSLPPSPPPPATPPSSSSSSSLRVLRYISPRLPSGRRRVLPSSLSLRLPLYCDLALAWRRHFPPLILVCCRLFVCVCACDCASSLSVSHLTYSFRLSPLPRTLTPTLAPLLLLPTP